MRVDKNFVFNSPVSYRPLTNCNSLDFRSWNSNSYYSLFTVSPFIMIMNSIILLWKTEAQSQTTNNKNTSRKWQTYLEVSPKLSSFTRSGVSLQSVIEVSASARQSKPMMIPIRINAMNVFWVFSRIKSSLNSSKQYGYRVIITAWNCNKVVKWNQNDYRNLCGFRRKYVFFQ